VTDDPRPRHVHELLELWRASGSLAPWHQELAALLVSLDDSLRRAQKVPQGVDRRCMALVVTKLEEAEHWALHALRVSSEAARARSLPMAMLPNDHHPGPRCSCRECLREHPLESPL